MKKKKQYKRRQVEDDIIANYSEKLNPIIIARRCMNFQGIKCHNKECINKSCPLNKEYD